MTFVWPRVRLGDLLKPVWREEVVDPSKEYRLLGARWYAGGLFLKDVKSGQEILAKRLYRVRTGDFVYNRLFAWKGSFALATDEIDNCYVSNEFPCFEIERARLDGSFLWSYFRREETWAHALGLSSGATPTSRNRLKESLFLEMEIPLPPLPEQQRVMGRVESLNGLIKKARLLRDDAGKELVALSRSILSHDGAPRITPMRELVRLRAPDVAVEGNKTYQFAGVYSFGRGVFMGPAKSGREFSYRRLTRLRSGDFVYPKLMAWEGAFGVVPPDYDGYVVSTEFPVFEVMEDRVLPEVLDTHFRDPSVWPELSGASTGTNVRRRRLNPQDFLNYQMPVPSRVTQEILRAVRSSTTELERMQAQTATELRALVPAILDRAFKAEL